MSTRIQPKNVPVTVPPQRNVEPAAKPVPTPAPTPSQDSFGSAVRAPGRSTDSRSSVSTRTAMNRALTELASPPATNPYAQYVDSVRKDLSAAGLPTKAPNVRTVVCDIDKVHGEKVARSLAGPIGLGQGAEGHLTTSATRQAADGSIKRDNNAMVDQAISRLKLDPATAERMKGAALMDDPKEKDLGKIKMGSLDDAATQAINLTELSVQSRRTELDRVKTDIVKGDTSKPTVVNMSWGSTQFSIAKKTADVAIAKAKADPNGSFATELKTALQLPPGQQVSEKDKSALAILIAEKTEKKMADPAASASVTKAKSQLSEELKKASQNDRIMVVTSAGNDGQAAEALNKDLKARLAESPQNAAFIDRAKPSWSTAVTSDVPGMLVVGSSDLGDAKKIGDENVAKHSSVGQTVSAPGVDVPIKAPKSAEELKQPLSASGKPYPVGESGTSLASPHVAGVVALMLEANPKLSQSDVQNIIQQTSKSIPGASTGDVGSRVIDPAAAVKQAAAMKASNASQKPAA